MGKKTNYMSAGPLLQSFSQLRMRYSDKDRESQNVEDRSNEPPTAPQRTPHTPGDTVLMPRTDAEAATLRRNIGTWEKQAKSAESRYGRNKFVTGREAEAARGREHLKVWDRAASPEGQTRLRNGLDVASDRLRQFEAADKDFKAQRQARQNQQSTDAAGQGSRGWSNTARFNAIVNRGGTPGPELTARMREEQGSKGK